MATAFTYTYDRAIQSLAFSRFGSILEMSSLGSTDIDRINKGVFLCPKGIAQRIAAEKRGENFLEFINIYPTRFEFDWKRQRTSVARHGLRYQKNDGSYGTIKANAIFIEYNMWFWSKSLDKVRQCMEKYVKWQQDNPKITFYFEENFAMNPDLKFSAVIDESHIEDIFNTGKVWVYRMPVGIEGWLPDLGDDESAIQKIRLTIYDKDDLEEYDVALDGTQDTELASVLKLLRANLYNIIDLNLITNSVSVSKDRSEDFTVGDKIRIEESTENNEIYTVVSVVYSLENDETEIFLSEALVGSTVDGNIYKHED